MKGFIRETNFGATYTVGNVVFSRETAVGLIAAGLGLVGGASVAIAVLYGLGMITCASWVYALAVYMATTIIPFHLGEWFTASHYRPAVDSGPKSFLLINTPAYTIASAAALIEFGLEVLLVPDGWRFISTDNTWIVTVAGFLSLGFYLVRLVGMVQCGKSFSHQIETTHREEHVMVTSGLYAYIRHPSYFGWFWRTSVCQIVLMNPICFVAFIVVTWRFFEDRIKEEEELLESEEFFGQKYTNYKRRVPTYIPFL